MNFKMVDKRRLVSYFQATSNEIALDVLCYKAMNVSPKAGNYMPRPTKLLKYSNKYFIKILKIFWIYILGDVLFLKQFLSYLLKKTKMPKSEVIIKNSSVGIAFSDRAMDIINKKNCDISPEYWIVFPWTDSSRLDEKVVKVEFLSLLTIGELWRAFFFAICAHKRMAKASRYKKWILQSYTSYKWFTIRIALEKIEADFFIAEHFDRWSVMMDGILVEQRRNNLNSNLVLVQHGLVADVGDESLIVPYKLGQFKRLYLYDKSTEEYFRKNILSKNINMILEDVKFYDSLLSIKKIPKANGINVLFVGHSTCIDLHVFILNELISKYDLVAYYKPHPVEKISKLIYKQKWIVIEDKHYFPAVDILISYPSTLVHEYELHGINSVVHSYDLKNDSARLYLEELEREIAARQNK